MKYIIAVIILLASTIALAVTYPSVTWVDTDKHAIAINTDGSVTINFVAVVTTPTVQVGYPSVSLIDNTNNVRMAINSDGGLNLRTK